MKREYYSTSECAEILRVSRITIFNWIKKRRILAKKYAGNYIVPASEIEKIKINRSLRDEDKSVLRSFVSLLLKDYGDFLKIID